MKKNLLLPILSLIFTSSIAQHKCATGHDSYEVELQRQNLLQQIKAADTYQKRSSNQITYVPIKMSLFGQDDGTGYASADSVNNMLAELNLQYMPANIQFFFSGTSFAYFPSTIFNNSYESLGDMLDFQVANGATNAINVYIKYSIFINGQNYGGLSPITPSEHMYNYMLIQNYGLNDDYTACHEFGHYFGLYHTFTEWVEGGNLELVTRDFNEVAPRISANCDSSSDYLCDTPADSYGQVGSSVELCEYTGTTTDLNNDSFAPSMSNFMSYYNCYPYTFTPQQYSRLQDGLDILSNPTNTFTLDAPETVQNPPSNVAATASDYGFTVTWSDNSDTETGYIIERSGNADGPFIPVAGVGKNVTSLTNVSGINGGMNYFRIKPSNSKTNYSVVSAGASANFICQNSDNNSCYTAANPAFQVLRIEDFTLSKGGVTLIENIDSACSENGVGNYYNSFEGIIAPDDVIDFNVKSHAAVDGFAYDVVVKLYVDWNQDFSFDSVGELVFTSPETLYEVSGNFTVPSNISTGSFRLRAVLSNSSIPIEPCYVQYGEMEDYKLTNNSLAIGESEQDQLSLFPNPVSELLTISVPSEVVITEIVVTDLSGKIIGSQLGSSNIVNTEELASGMYILQVMSAEKKFIAKFIKH